MPFTKPPVIIDNGSRYIKAGFACDNHPVSMFRTVVGRPRNLRGRYAMPGRSDYYDVFIGDDAISSASKLDYELNSPVVNGRIVHWDNMERVWHHIFYRELKAAPEDRAVLLACTSATPMAEKMKCCQVFFELLNVPAVCIQPQGVLSLFGSGVTTGVCVDIGYDTTDIDPVYEGGRISYAHMHTGCAAAQVSKHIQEHLIQRNIDLGPNASEILDDIMKQSLYITQDLTMPRKGYERLYTLPEGKQIDVSQEAFLAGELFFQPDLVKKEKTKYSSLSKTVVTSCLKCDAELRPELYSAVVMAGGLSMMPGVAERLSTELEAITKKPVNVMTSPESYVVSWLGAATFAGISEAWKLFVTRKQFEEHGLRIVKNKFL